jgi:hypothetical protein
MVRGVRCLPGRSLPGAAFYGDAQLSLIKSLGHAPPKCKAAPSQVVSRSCNLCLCFWRTGLEFPLMNLKRMVILKTVNPWTCGILALVSVFSGPVFTKAQDQASPQKKPDPAKILPDIFVLGDQVVREQWPATLDPVNAPSDLKVVEPGQCVRFGVIATGDDRYKLLNAAMLTVEFTFAAKTETIVNEALQAEKKIKPQGGDLVTEALGVAGIQNPVQSLASLAASRAAWCAPVDLHDGEATMRGRVTTSSGESISLIPRSIQVRTFATAQKQAAFTDMNTFGSWLQNYYAAPDPAQLLLGLRVIASDKKARLMLNIMTFFIEALRASPAAAHELMRMLPAEDPSVRIYAIPLLSKAGYAIDSLLDGFKEDEKTVLRSVNLPDPFDLTPDRSLPSRMDMLWAVFFATGRVEPVRAVASMLAWHNDYDKFMKMRESGQKPTELTDSIMRGVVYGAAGWSLNALSRNDGLVADYIDAFKSSANTPAVVKAELANLHTNPVFTKK